MEEGGGSGSAYASRDPVIPARGEGRRGREGQVRSNLRIAVRGRTVQGMMVHAGVHKSGCVKALEEGTLGRKTRGSNLGYTAARVGKASQIEEAEKRQSP